MVLRTHLLPLKELRKILKVSIFLPRTHNCLIPALSRITSAGGRSQVDRAPRLVELGDDEVPLDDPIGLEEAVGGEEGEEEGEEDPEP